MFTRNICLTGLLIVAACANAGSGHPSDAGSAADGLTIDGHPADGPQSGDAAGGIDGMVQVDAGVIDAVIPDADSPDAQVGPITDTVEIYIDNFCNTSAVPTSYTVPAGETLRLSYHNNSVDYEADVWLSYGGGYLDLAKGDTWHDSFEFCTAPGPYTAYADISIAGGGGDVCPKFRLYLYCE